MNSVEEKKMLEGQDVVTYLNGSNTVRDGSLVNLSVQNVATEAVIELTFEVLEADRIRVVKLELRSIQEFCFSYIKTNPPDVIQFLKCILTEQGDFNLSLDPYDEREKFISEKDGDFFRSQLVRLEETEVSRTKEGAE